jgi:phage protein D
MAKSPRIDSDDPLRLTIHCAGAEQADLKVISVQVRRAFNVLPWARIELIEGDTPDPCSPPDDGALFLPGTDIAIKAGYGHDQETIFTGIVVRHGFRISGSDDSRLVVECGDKACKMTQGRNSAHHVHQTDSAVILKLIGNAGLQADVAATTITHEQLVQYHCSDWDFMLARADALGLLVDVDGGRVSVQPPAFGAASSLSLTRGSDLIEFAGDIGAGSPRGAVQGRARFQGNAAARPGCLIDLKGVGRRFDGPMFVSAVEHEIRDGNWTSVARFGIDAKWQAQRADLVAAPTGGLLAGVGGLQTGVVLKLDGDPAGENRIMVGLPMLQATTGGLWARLLQTQASSGFGAFFVPEVGDEVVVGFFNEDPSHPVILGSLYSSRHPSPFALTAGNNTQALVTRCKHRIELDEDQRTITITTASANQVVLKDSDQSVLVQDQHGNRIRLGSDGIALDSPRDITLKARGGITLDATGAIHLKSKADVKTAGLNIHCEAEIGFAAKGAASAELSASGQTTVKGAMVMIN